MRIAVLWTKLSGYLNACLRELAKAPGVELMVCNEAANQEAPYEGKQFYWIENQYEYTGAPDFASTSGRLEAFGPDVILGAAYHVPAYRQVCSDMRGKCLRVYCTDNQWTGSVKQVCASVISGRYLLPLYDAVFVPGERQANWARKLGFRQSQIWYGALSCDHAAFSEAYASRRGRVELPQSFIYVGRLVAMKGVATLAEGYKIYRSQEASRDREAKRWPLTIVGNGPLSSLFEGHRIPGVTAYSFVQPSDIPMTLAEAGCLVIAGHDPWGVIIHEAASAGLPIICSAGCGASVHLAQDGHNGFVVDADSAESMAGAMSRFASLSSERRRQMGEAGALLAQQFTPQRWAQCVIERASSWAEREIPQLALAASR